MLRKVNTVHVTSDFKKSFRKLPKQIQNLAIKKDELFRHDAFSSSLRTHNLKGSLEGFWSYSLNISYRVLFRFIHDDEVIYYDIGTHQIYK